ncbi:TPA: capsular biosynthesis protein CpsH [Streptococcus suis]
MTKLVGKKVLFFSPAFFGYEKKIVNKLTELGAEVKFYDVRSVQNSFSRALLKVSPKIFNNQSQKYYDKILDEEESENFDYILIVKCDMTPISALKRMRDLYPNAKLILYLWDSMKNIPGIEQKIVYFDRLLTFDLEDSKKNKSFHFRPLFYADEFISKSASKSYKYDLVFLGTIHSDRYSIIKKIESFAKNNNLNSFYFCYLQSKFIYFFYKITKPEFFDAKQSFFAFEKMSSESISKVVEESNIIIDIEHPKQNGLTMRTIEMIGMQKKILTTNKSIQEYDFYNEENIYVIDRNVSKLDINFFNTPYKPVDSEIYAKYSLKQWIIDVLGVGNEQ